MSEWEGGSDFSAMIGKVLNDPDAMQSIMKMATAITGGGTQTEESVMPPTGSGETNAMIQERSQHSSDSHGDRDRTALLRALKPFLNEDRQSKAEAIIRITGLLSAAEKMGVMPFRGSPASDNDRN